MTSKNNVLGNGSKRFEELVFMLKGYAKLSDSDKSVFQNFQQEFLKVNDSEIEFLSVARKRDCLRVDLQINKKTEWLHVTTYNWY